MEASQALILTLGATALLISWGMLLIQSFREDFTWGLCTLLLPPLSYLYCLWHFKETREVMLVTASGLVLLGLGLVL